MPSKSSGHGAVAATSAREADKNDGATSHNASDEFPTRSSLALLAVERQYGQTLVISGFAVTQKLCVVAAHDGISRKARRLSPHRMLQSEGFWSHACRDWIFRSLIARHSAVHRVPERA